MPKKPSLAEQLRIQIEGAASLQYPIEDIELKIAASLVETGQFQGNINEEELTSIIRKVVYDRFTKQRIRGFDISLVHNVAAISVRISGGEVHVSFLVHIHSPIIAFLRFRYVLIDEKSSGKKKIGLKRGSLYIRKDTRRFDFKAKAALAAVDVDEMARAELADLAGILRSTFSKQLHSAGISGEFKDIRLAVGEGCLDVRLEGHFRLPEKTLLTS